MSFELVKVDNIVIPKVMFHPMKTGNASLDNMFSNVVEGIVPSQVTLVTAMPGAGKSTLCSVIGAGVAEWLETINEADYPEDFPLGPVVYISREMSDFQLKMMTSSIPNFGKVNLITGKVNHDFTEYLSYLIKIQPSLVIVDSLQKIASESKNGGRNQKQIDMVNAFTEFAKAMYSPVLLIGHVSKEGRYLGPSTIAHEVDSHLHMEIDTTDNVRVVQMKSKNRFGDINKPYYLEKKDNVYEFYSKEETDSDVGLDDPFEVWSNFCQKTNYAITDYKRLVISTINHLKFDFANELEEKHIDKDNLKITFQPGFFNIPKKSLLNIDLSKIKELDLDVLTKSSAEAKLRDSICEGHHHFVFWYILREFMKLIYHDDSSSPEFYSKVSRSARKYFSTFNLQ